MIDIPWLEDGSTHFPNVESSLKEPNGLLAVGGDLSPPQLLAAYKQGIFPWFDETQPPLWWSPNPRLILKPDQLHISKSMTKLIRKSPFSVTTDTAFEEIMRACSEPREKQEGTWISEQMIDAYCELYRLGYAHSVEVWSSGKMVGGLYGVALGEVFFGESMFSRCSNASKYGFTLLTLTLRRHGYKLIDCQVYSDHLASLGAVEIPRQEFQKYLLEYIPSGGIDSLSIKSNWPQTLDIKYNP